MVLKVETPPKPTIENFVKKKRFYENWEYSNSFCLMVMKNHMEDSIYASIPKIEMQKSSWMLFLEIYKVLKE